MYIQNCKNNSKISIIWNLTRLCVWRCPFCCVNAKLVQNKSLVNIIKDKSCSYQNELNFLEKCAVINQLSQEKFTIDFSGGELLIDPLNVDLLEYASKKLGKDSISISVSGAFLDNQIIERLSGKINTIELTLDMNPNMEYELRECEYHETAASAIERLKQKNFRVGVQTVLTKANIQDEKIVALFNWLDVRKVDSWSLLRFFPAGRGEYFKKMTPIHEEYCHVVKYIKEISKESAMEINFQYLLPNHKKYTLECRAVKKSIGILPNGIVTACFWALNEHMQPNRDQFILGKLPEECIDDILHNEKSLFWLKSKKKCEIFTRELLAT